MKEGMKLVFVFSLVLILCLGVVSAGLLDWIKNLFGGDDVSLSPKERALLESDAPVSVGVDEEGGGVIPSPGETTCVDSDGDGYNVTGEECGILDCDDTRGNVFPGHADICDGLDNDCNLGTLDGSGECSGDTPICYAPTPGVLGTCVTDFVCSDADGDGYNATGGECGLVDCDDGDKTIHPDAVEICDGVDNNCFSGIDEGCQEICSDSDGGLNYYVKGTVSVAKDNTTELYLDVCNYYSLSNTLGENYCEGDVRKIQAFTCPDGCFDGACISNQGNETNVTTCLSDDDCPSVTEKYCVGDNAIFSTTHSSCQSGQCVSQGGGTGVKVCPNGCFDGECIGGVPEVESVKIEKVSDKWNLGETHPFTGGVTDDNLPNFLKDGIYYGKDNNYSYSQMIYPLIPNEVFGLFRDSDYEDMLGLSEKTPTLGLRLTSNTFVLNYTLDFGMDVPFNSNMMEGTFIDLLGKSYYISSVGTNKLILIDSTSMKTVLEGETVSVSSGGKYYEVSIDYIDSDEVKLIVNGETVPASGTLGEGDSYKLNDGAYIGVIDISKLEIQGELGNVAFSIGSGKLEITHGQEIKLNDEWINGVKGFLYNSGGNLDKIVVEWIADDEGFVAPDVDLIIPGFDNLRLSYEGFTAPAQEKISISPDGDTSIEVDVAIEDGPVSFNYLYSNGVNEFMGLGKSSDERLAVSDTNTLLFKQKDSLGNDYHEYFFASWVFENKAESYLLRAKITEDTTAGRNETTIEKNANGAWVVVCPGKVKGDLCFFGNVNLTIGDVFYNPLGERSVEFLAGPKVVFDQVCTKEGLIFNLPTEEQVINFPWAGSLVIYEENKYGDLYQGEYVYFSLNFTSEGKTTVNGITGVDSGFLEMGDSDKYKGYVYSDLGTEVVWSKTVDEWYAAAYYHGGESYGNFYLMTGADDSTEPLICGDINSDEEGPDIADLTYLISYLFQGGPVPESLWSANVDGQDQIDIGDVSWLVDYLFISFGDNPLACVPVDYFGGGGGGGGTIPLFSPGDEAEYFKDYETTMKSVDNAQKYGTLGKPNIFQRILSWFG